MIHFDKVSKVYTDNTSALVDISFSIEPKEFVSIVGHSGAGKTTLIKMILGEEKPSKGRIFYESVDISTLNREQVNGYRRKVGVVFQDFRLLPKVEPRRDSNAGGESDDEGQPLFHRSHFV